MYLTNNLPGWKHLKDGVAIEADGRGVAVILSGAEPMRAEWRTGFMPAVPTELVSAVEEHRASWFACNHADPHRS